MLNMAEGVARLGALAESPVVATLARAFAEAGFDLAIVGGPVRDALLGRTVNDLDFTTDARPDDILRIVKPISTAQWDIGRAFGTIGAKVDPELPMVTSVDEPTREEIEANAALLRACAAALTGGRHDCNGVVAAPAPSAGVSPTVEVSASPQASSSTSSPGATASSVPIQPVPGSTGASDSTILLVLAVVAAVGVIGGLFLVLRRKPRPG